MSCSVNYFIYKFVTNNVILKISIYIDRKHIVLYEYNALWERGDLYISIIYRNDQKPCFFALMRTFLHKKVLYKYNKYIILMYILRMI